MVKSKYRWTLAVAAILCSVVLFTCIAGNASASQITPIEPITGTSGNPTMEFAAAPITEETPEYVSTMEEAAQILREQLKDRKSYAVVYLHTTRYDENTLDTLFDMAVGHTGEPTEGDYISRQYKGWEATLTGTDWGGVYDLKLEYAIEYYTTQAQENQVDAVVEELLAQLDLEDATDYQKVKGVYDWLCQNVTYDYDLAEVSHSAYAALINRTAVCQGYATAMYRLMLELDVDIRYVGGWGFDEHGRPGAHGWNIVKLGQKYYNVDATWDAVYKQAGWPYQYFLKSDADFDAHLRNDEQYGFANTNAYPIAGNSYADECFTVIFKNYDGSVLSRKTYGFGQTIVAPEAPVKAADNIYTYQFSGWDQIVDTCQEDRVFTATYEKNYIIYTVQFKYEDGTLIAEDTYHYGDLVSTPAQVTAPEGFVHTGWDSQVTNCYGNKVYIATFAESVGRGDIDGDNLVTNKDVIYLLWHTLFPESYQVTQNVDYNGDSNINNQDVIYLLWHTLFPESYPLR